MSYELITSFSEGPKTLPAPPLNLSLHWGQVFSLVAATASPTVPLMALLLPTPTSNKGERTEERTGHDSDVNLLAPNCPRTAMQLSLHTTSSSSLMPTHFPRGSLHRVSCLECSPACWPGCYSCFYITCLGRPSCPSILKQLTPFSSYYCFLQSTHQFYFLVSFFSGCHPTHLGTWQGQGPLSCSCCSRSAWHGQMLSTICWPNG